MRTARALAVIVIVMLAVTGCGRRSKDEPTPAEQPTAQQTAALAEGPVKLVVAVEGDESVQRRINEYLAQDPLLRGVTIETVPYPLITLPYLDQVAGELQMPGGPDILVTSSSNAAYLSLIDGVYPLNEGIERHALLSQRWQELHPGAVERSQFEGVIHSAPRSIDLAGILYRKEYVTDRGLVIEPEWDWNDLAAMSRGLRPFLQDLFDQSDDPLLRHMARDRETLRPFTLCHGTSCWLPFVWSNGGEHLTGEPIVNSIQNAQTFEWLQSHIINGDIGFDRTSRTWFDRGAIAMTPGSISRLRTLNQDGDAFGFAPLPRSPYTGESVPLMSTSAYVVSPGSTNIQAALDFLTVALSPEGQSVTARELWELPVHPDDDMPSNPGLPAVDILRTTVNKARSQPFSAGLSMPMEYDQFEAMYYGSMTVNSFLEEAESALRIAVESHDRYWWRELPRAGDASPSTSFFGGSETSAGPPRQEPPSDEWERLGGVRITFLANNSEFIPLVDEFNRSQSRIYVELASTRADTSSDDAFVKSIATGHYDVFDVPIAFMDTLIGTGSLIPLDRFLSTGVIDTSYDGGAINQARMEGTLYSIPLERRPFLVLARQEAWEASGYTFPADGWTWNDYLDWARKMTNPVAGLYGAAMDPFHYRVMAALRGYDENMYPYPNQAADLRLFRDLYTLLPDSVRTAPTALEDVMVGTALSTLVIADNPRLYAENQTVVPYTLLPLPTLDSTSPMSVGYYGMEVGIASTTQYPHESFTFIAWLMEQNERVAMSPSRIPQGRIPLRITPQALTELERIYGPHAASLFVNPYRLLVLGDVERYDHTNTVLLEYATGKISLEEAMSQIGAGPGAMGG